MVNIITKVYRARELDGCPGCLHFQIVETANKFLEQHGLYIFTNFVRQDCPPLFFHYNEGASGMIDYNSKTVEIKGLAGVINNTKNVLESVSEGIKLEKK